VLIREFASGCDVHLVGSSHLAGFAEAELAGEPAADIAIKHEIAGCFVDGDGRRTDTIVLACTHYPLLLDRFRVGAPWPVTWLDPAPAIARRVADLMRDRKPGEPPPAPQIVFTSGRNRSPRLGVALAAYGV
jgi:glutamate racemase